MLMFMSFFCTVTQEEEKTRKRKLIETCMLMYLKINLTKIVRCFFVVVAVLIETA